MSDTKITYKGNKGFWINRSFIQLVYYYMYNELNKSQYNISDKDDLLYSIKFNLDGYSEGMSLNWSQLNQLDEQVMLQILQNIRANLQGKGKYISIDELQGVATEDDDFKTFYSRKPFPTAELIKIIDTLIKMFQGTWDSTNYNMDINYQY